MTERVKLVVVAVVLIASMCGLGACNSGGGAGSGTATSSDISQSAVAAVDFQTYSQGTESGFIMDEYALEEPTLFVIRTQAELDAFWTRHAAIFMPQPSEPVIDFDQDMLVAVVDSVEPTSGYSITIQEIDQSGDHMVVKALLTSPSADAIVGDALTVPYHIVTMSRTDQTMVLGLSEATK